MQYKYICADCGFDVIIDEQALAKNHGNPWYALRDSYGDWTMDCCVHCPDCGSCDTCPECVGWSGYDKEHGIESFGEEHFKAKMDADCCDCCMHTAFLMKEHSVHGSCEVIENKVPSWNSG